jgi:hypothetical protein
MSDDKRAHKVFYMRADGEVTVKTVKDFSLTANGHLVVTYHAAEHKIKEGETGLINASDWSAVEPYAVDPDQGRSGGRRVDDLQTDLFDDGEKVLSDE